MFIHWVYIFPSFVYIVTGVGRLHDVLDLLLIERPSRRRRADEE